MPIRSFPEASEELCKSWFSGPSVAPVEWIVAGPTLRGTHKAFAVSAHNFFGYAKPGSRDVEPAAHAVAAHEKICSDLAYVLKLPVPPVTLWDRVKRPESHSRFVAVSGHIFANPYTWEQLQQNAPLASHFLAALKEPASAMAPFDTWVNNLDRSQPANLLLSHTASRDAAYIDFANSLSLVWKTKGYQVPSLSPCFPAEIDADLNIMAAVIDAIESMPESTLKSTVTRIPQAFLPITERELIIEGLLYRRRHLREYMMQQYPSLQ